MILRFKVYLVGDITAFVMYYVYGVPESTVLIESTDSMIMDGYTKYYSDIYVNNAKITGNQIFCGTEIIIE